MTRALAVPICLDALHLTSPTSVVEAKMNFTKMPYWDGKEEINPDVANISEDLASHPFQDRALVLPPGVHLHWTLPEALTRGSSCVPESYPHTMLYPAAPNRWLVTRSLNDVIEKKWVVESDYLYPEDAAQIPNDTLVPIAIPFQKKDGLRPYYYLGRQHEIKDFKDSDTAPSYLRDEGYHLTAVGYQAVPKPGDAYGLCGLGEPTFAALYPNCLSVFGFHDKTPPTNMAGVTYEVIGWFQESDDDCLKSQIFKESQVSILKETEGTANPLTDVELTKKALIQAFGWDVADTMDAVPNATLLHASIKMDQKAPSEGAATSPPLTVAIGNTGTEALSAYLADLKGDSHLETQLEALHLADSIDHLTLDIGVKFQQARHDRGFSSAAGGTIWSIREHSVTAEKTVPLGNNITPAAAKEDEENRAHLLNQLNMAQEALDQTQCALNCRQKQLYADWYKYMLCAYPPIDAPNDYPDIDEVRFFIEHVDLKPIKEKLNDIKRKTQERDAAKSDLAKVLPKHFGIHARAGNRFYHPQDPVLLIVGDGLRITNRYEKKGTLRCSITTLQGAEITTESLATDYPKFRITQNDNAPGAWHPFSLDWRVAMQHTLADDHSTETNRTYNPDCLLQSHELKQDAFELMLSDDGKQGLLSLVSPSSSIYSGSSLITPHPKYKLIERINTFLSKRLLKPYFEAKNIPIELRTNDYFERNVDAIKAWYTADKKTKPAIADPLVDTILDIAATVDADNFHVMAQALNGFNEALLMHKQTMQLPLEEPLGFQSAKEFTQKVNSAVGKNTYVAPQPLDNFHPIRSGLLRVLDLRLVDTFGRVQDLDIKKWVSSTMPPSGEVGSFLLPPRFAQPARLRFRWLAANSIKKGDEVEMNSHPATTPICGWILPNHLDQSLMIYDPEGKALGFISAHGEWQYAPGGNHIEISEFPSRLTHLQQLVKHLWELDKTRLSAFSEQVKNALDQIHPVRSADEPSLALFIGRPIAVVRAKLKLEIQGEPALNQSWDAFRTDLQQFFQAGGEPPERSSDGFTKVQIPIRLGDDRQLNDGLLGYWIEHEAPSRYTTYHSGNASTIKRHVNEATTLTMLMDPRGVVHVASGVLPAEALEIPPEHYQPGMQALEAWFLTAPILSPVDKITLPLPTEAGHAWSWVAASANSAPVPISTATTQAHWAEPLEIHDGWLKLTTSSNT